MSMPRRMKDRRQWVELILTLNFFSRSILSSLAKSSIWSCSGCFLTSLDTKSSSLRPESITRAAASSCIIGPLAVITIVCRLPFHSSKVLFCPMARIEAHARWLRVSKRAVPRALSPTLVAACLKHTSRTARCLRSSARSPKSVLAKRSPACRVAAKLSVTVTWRFVPAKAKPVSLSSPPCHVAVVLPIGSASAEEE